MYASKQAYGVCDATAPTFSRSFSSVLRSPILILAAFVSLALIVFFFFFDFDGAEPAVGDFLGVFAPLANERTLHDEVKACDAMGINDDDGLTRHDNVRLVMDHMVVVCIFICICICMCCLLLVVL